MNVYQHPTESRTFYAPDTEPTTTLPFPLWHITGLDNFSIPHPQLVNRKELAKAQGIDPEKLNPNATTGSGPSASFLGSDMRAAYYTSGGGTLTGAGQNLGLFEYEGTDIADLNTYFTNAGQTNNVPITLRSSDGTTTTCLYTKAGGDCDDGEQTLDMTQALGMAPGLASLTMYIGSNDTPILSDMVTHYPLPTTIGCSWGWSPADPTSDDPNIVSVGGTDLVTTGAAGPWASETAWAAGTPCTRYGCSSGGISTTNQPIPSWQKLAGVITTANQGSTTLRNGPDVSANANFTFYLCSDQSGCTANEEGGTSFAAPMWAGYLALVNQGIAANGGSTIGFINPLIYPENLVAATYAANFHDITSGSNSGTYPAVTGYDLVTGWGSPTTKLAATLIATPAGSPYFFLTTPTIAYTGVTAGTVETDTVDITSRYGFAGSVALSCVATGGMTCTFAPSSATLTSNANSSTTLTIGTAGVNKTGTYTVTVTGTGGGVTPTTLVISVTVTTVSASSFSVTPTSTALSPTTSTFTDPITVAAIGTFTGAVNLTCSGAGGITCSLSPTAVTLTSGGTGTSTLTMVDSGVTASGTYNVVVTGKDAATGNIVETGTVAVTVTLPDYSIKAASASLTGQGTLTDALTLTSVGGFTGSPALTCTAAGSLTCSFSPTSVALTSGGTGTSTLSVVTTGVVTAGTYNVVVTATSGTDIHTLTVPVTVTAVVAPSLTLTNAGAVIIASQGASGTTGLTLTANPTFSGSVALTCAVTSQPSGATYLPTCSVAPSPVSLTYNATGTSTLTINTTPQTLAAISLKPVTWLAGGLLAALLLIPARRRRLPLLAALFTTALLLGNVLGCSGSSTANNQPTYTGGTTLGGYIVTVTATSGSVSATTPVTLTVN